MPKNPKNYRNDRSDRTINRSIGDRSTAAVFGVFAASVCTCGEKRCHPCGYNARTSYMGDYDNYSSETSKDFLICFYNLSKVPKRILIRLNASELIRTGPDRWLQVRKLRKDSKHLRTCKGTDMFPYTFIDAPTASYVFSAFVMLLTANIPFRAGSIYSLAGRIQV